MICWLIDNKKNKYQTSKLEQFYVLLQGFCKFEQEIWDFFKTV